MRLDCSHRVDSGHSPEALGRRMVYSVRVWGLGFRFQRSRALRLRVLGRWIRDARTSGLAVYMRLLHIKPKLAMSRLLGPESCN